MTHANSNSEISLKIEHESKLSEDLQTQIKEIQQKYAIIGRSEELYLLLIALRAQKNIILEGGVDTGKTYLARSLAQYAKQSFFRVDGSEDVLSHTLVGYFDPPVVMAKGYKEEAFIYGPLSQAMLEGGCLFINELNRVPESTQNVLLSALDEQIVIVPKLKTIHAQPGFITMATQNPAAHVGVSALGEALKDRFVWIQIDYQPEAEEIEIVELLLDTTQKHAHYVATIAVRIVDASREHPDLRRGASIRGAIDLAQLAQAYGKKPSLRMWKEIAVMALNPKVELIDGTNRSSKKVICEIVDTVLDHFQ